ncbi:MAG: tetratricopeptide repeat protein [Candidatus Hydrogenedentes bacterium]|nr:tetratricopeptide repeat protein [Candidatus Hydrogenedentota bacterium]
MTPDVSEKHANRILAFATFSLCSLAIALPWELFQRLPFTGFTVAKLAGVVTVACAIALAIADRRYRWPRTGIGAPLAVLATVCVISITYSLDRAATLRQLVVYASYLAFIFAAVTFIGRPTISRLLVHCYIISSMVVAVVTVACYAGALWPTSWTTASTPLQRLILEYRHGVPMRMVAAGNDFNQAAMLILVAFVASLFLYQGRALLVSRRFVLHTGQILLVSALFISMSRSAVILAGLFAVYWLVTVPRRRWLAAAFAAGLCILGVLLLAYFAQGFWETFIHRAQGGVAHDDASIRGRWQVYQIGFALLPEYGLWGCGLGAVDAAMTMSRFKDEAVMTMHSLPMIFLLELGIAGFFAYLWLLVRLVKTVREWPGHDSIEARFTGRALTATVLAIIAMTVVQPFPFLPLYPFIIALICGPYCGKIGERDDETSSKPRFTVRRGPIALAAVFVGIVVVVNQTSYQITASRLADAVDGLAAGLDAERSANWSVAVEHYRTVTNDGRGISMDSEYAGIARALVDPEPVFLAMNIPWLDPPLQAAAHYGLGRACLAQNEVATARNAFEAAWTLDARFNFLRFDLAEALWSAGLYADAIRLYGEAAEVPSALLSNKQRKAIAVVKSRTDAATALHTFSTMDNHWRSLLPNRLLSGNDASDEASRLERGLLLRRLGRWTEALVVYQETLTLFPMSAEATFNLGVQSEIEGHADRAIELYRKTVQLSPHHADAAKRLSAITPS